VNKLEYGDIRQSEEADWQREGEQAFYTGILYSDWPHPEGTPYSNRWYRIKTAWQRGWMSASGMQPLLPLGLSWVNTSALPLDKLAVLIEELTPIRARVLIRKFSVPLRKQVEQALIKMAEEGKIQLTGGGHRGSPVMIDKIGFREIDLNKSEEDENESE
jgi:hypothetical protein